MPFGSKRIISTGETDFLLDDIVPYVVVAEMLQSSPTQLRYLLHGRSEELRYTTFTIAKRRRGVRAILAPKEDLKSIQRRLSDLLQNRFSVKLAAHGFVRNRSICTNAKCHIGYRIVFKLDLKDFFPTINFGRVRGLFMADPFNASPNVATILAQICCHKGSLPQGAPSSPVVSNMVCYRLDAQLLRLARVHGCVYTRYADDITFSKRKGQFPTELAIEGVTSDFTVGKELRAIIEGNGFQIHPDKVHLHRNTTRQAVTGLIVNNRLNVPREFVRNIRAVICDWRKRGLAAAQATHHETFYPHQSRRRRKPTLPKIIEGRLGFLKIVKGPYDKVRKNLQRQFVAICPDYQATMERENRELSMRDFFISHASEDKDLVRPLAEALIREGLSVWYDEYEITIGDDVASKINAGLLSSRYGIIVLSPHFFNVKKNWPDREVGALFALEDADKRPRVLPIWHNVDQPDVAAKSPMLAAKMAWKCALFSPDQLAKKFRTFLNRIP